MLAAVFMLIQTLAPQVSCTCATSEPYLNPQCPAPCPECAAWKGSLAPWLLGQPGTINPISCTECTETLPNHTKRVNN